MKYLLQMSEKYDFSDSSRDGSSDDEFLETEQNKTIKKNNFLLGKFNGDACVNGCGSSVCCVVLMLMLVWIGVLLLMVIRWC